jgi:membrane-associated phospholipid phosphatase
VAAVDAFRMYAYLSLAQFKAAEAAEATAGPHPPVSAAIGAASAVVLSAFFPSSSTDIEAALDAQEAAAPWPGAKHQDFAAGEAIGRQVGAQVLLFAATDMVGVANPLPAPVGPGYWIPVLPIRIGNLGARPFFLASGDEFRSPPPPAFGSPEYQAALAQVQNIVATRNPEQIANSLYWNANQSPRVNSIMNDLARDLIRTYRRSDADAARVLFLANGAAFDAIVGCFDAKYTYWLIRPIQADPTLTPLFPTPAHPSYPSAHSCISGSMTAVLAREFPSERSRLEALADEAGMSRVIAGIHYLFDCEAGVALGRAVAAKAAAADLSAISLVP